MAEEVCSSCGARNPAGTEFCQACGTYLRWDATSTDLPAASQPTTTTSVPAPPVPAPPPPPDLPAPAPQSIPASTTPTPIPKQPAPPADLVPGQAACPRCGTANPPERRFCAKCGQELQRPAAAGIPRLSVGTPPKSPWWQRVTGRVDGADPTAVRAYRRSLSPRSRSVRVVVALLVAAGLGGAFVVARRSPVTLARHLKNDLTNTLVRVQGVSAQSVPPAGAAPTSAAAVVDNNAATPWTTSWLGTADPAEARCAPIPKGAAAHLVLTLPRPTTVRVVQFVGSVADEGSRALQWRPRVLQVTFSDKSCRRLPVQSNGTTEVIKLDKPVPTSQITIEIAAADRPQATGSGPANQISISEIQLLSRPA